MFKPIFKAVAVSAVAAFFCVGCGDKSGDDPEEGGGEVKTSYTITFNANGGTVSPTSAKTDEDGILASLPTPTRDGYIFDGWYTGETSGTEVTVSNVYSANTTIYARWKEVQVAPPSDNAFTDSRDGKIYKKIVIGTQMWMAENLNYNATGSVCYENKADSCAKYGRLYNWATAMGIDTSYNNSRWKYGVDVKQQGVCPTGWRLPSDAEWTALMDTVGGESTAGIKLKSTSGWYNYDGAPMGNGTDEYGFSGLPSGYGVSYGSFYNIGYGGFWWNTTEYDASEAWVRYMTCCDFAEGGISGESVHRRRGNKPDLNSVRCVAD